eukprot:2148089-Karenia_brevis.AAC.1
MDRSLLATNLIREVFHGQQVQTKPDANWQISGWIALQMSSDGPLQSMTTFVGSWSAQRAWDKQAKERIRQLCGR